MNHCVYFLDGWLKTELGLESFTKVGYTNNLKIRMRNIRYAERKRGILDGLDDGPRVIIGGLSKLEAVGLEAQIHELLSKYHIKDEWFGITHELRDCIIDCLYVVNPKFLPTHLTVGKRLSLTRLAQFPTMSGRCASTTASRSFGDISLAENEIPNRFHLISSNHGGA
jgi:T5orf172 domain